ncbi:FG-GAP-like repeat-containing protein [Bacteroidota bacterium]
MKIRIDIYYSVIISIILILTGCDPKKRDERDSSIMDSKDTTKQQVIQRTPEEQRSIDAISARTMGLAYLEENKLEDAEAEFLKLVALAPEEALGYANLGIVYLRMGKYDLAEEKLEMAVELDPDDPDIRLNLARVYELTDQDEESVRELETTLEKDPDHVQSLYTLAESFGRSQDANSLQQWEIYMDKVVEAAPTNIVARLHLVEAMLRNNKGNEALKHLEEIERIYPELPSDASGFYKQALTTLQEGNNEDALIATLTFHNLLKLSNPYQAGIQQLKGTGGGLIGTPVITFSQASPGIIMNGESIFESIYFTDATEPAGLGVAGDFKKTDGEGDAFPHIALGDIDRDGDIDIYFGSPGPGGSRYKHYLFKNELGRFKDISSEADIDHSGVETSALFVDYNNDGFLDLYVVKEGSDVLYDNVSEGVFTDGTKKSGITGNRKGNKALFFDMDHEGDLDLFIATDQKNEIFRNNADATFTILTNESILAGKSCITRDAAFGDFDDDGDIDLLVINEDEGNVLYSNLRQGIFRDVTEASGLTSSGRSGSVACGDYNNDGYLDLFITALKGGNYRMMLNNGDGTFSNDEAANEIIGIIQNVIGYDAAFFDMDNDGYLDLLLSGESTDTDGRGVFLFHNDGEGNFEDASDILPDGITAGRQIAIADYNQDGDLDIYITGLQGGIRLLRNDGGNANHHLKVQLVGIRTGSGKNNHFGIGAKVEIRAGYLYQMRTVTEPNIYFGLGTHEKADVVRILWTNGVPQNIFSPGSDQDLIEEQQLKGSCPFLYTWNGKEYEFVKDMMWRSALGMPMGIMGDKSAYAFSNASDEYLKIPGESLQAEDGRYKIQVTSELWETIYIDKIRLIAVDHPESIDIYLDEKFTPPPFPGYHIYPVSETMAPASAADDKGNNLLPQILRQDNQYISNLTHSKYQGITEMHDLILDLGKNTNSDSLFLFLNGWIFPTDASINTAISQTDRINSIGPYLQVTNKKGEWVTIIENIGFPMGKNKTVVVDLSGKFLSEDRIVRIRTNMEIYWDHIFHSDCNQEVPVRSTTLEPISADLHYRGFSEMYRKGKDGPHWFDYKKVITGQKWRDLTGDYTRFGDVLELLDEADNRYIITNAGDETSITFSSTELPELPIGWKRDFVIYSVGWVKDGDLNTANGNTVDPLPYHGLTQYPYGKNDSYPNDPDLKQYHSKYNTRIISSSTFREAVKEY